MEDISEKDQQFCGTETILLADDNSAIRKLLSDILTSYGYTVITGKDGQEAVDLFKNNSDTIKLVIMDVMMPRKNGIDAFHEIKTIQQGIKVIFMGGYSSNMFHLFEFKETYLEKPLDLPELMLKIRDSLD